MISGVSYKLELVTNHKCLLGEGPVWDAKRNAIYWLDILNGQLHQFFTTTKEHRVLNIGQMIGCIAICQDGNFIAGVKEGLGFIDRDSGAIKMIATPESNIPGNRFNDGKCDPLGRFWAGTMAISEQEHEGNLYMLDSELRVEKKRGKVSISNGLAWTKDKRTLYYIDTPTREVLAFDFDLSTASISNERVVIRIADDEGSPDGMTIDSEDNLWIAHWGGWQVSRWDPATGKKLLKIPVPVHQVTCCTFGGDSLQDLYITTARVHLDAEAFRDQPMAGSLFVIRNCGFSGTESVEFARTLNSVDHV